MKTEIKSVASFGFLAFYVVGLFVAAATAMGREGQDGPGNSGALPFQRRACERGLAPMMRKSTVQSFDTLVAPFGLNVEADSDPVVALDIAVTQDQLRMRLLVDADYKLYPGEEGRWHGWLLNHGLVDGITDPIQGLRHLQIMYGPEVEALLTGYGPVLLLPPDARRAGSIFSGRFRLQGTLSSLRRFITEQEQRLLGNDGTNRFSITGAAIVGE